MNKKGTDKTPSKIVCSEKQKSTILALNNNVVSAQQRLTDYVQSIADGSNNPDAKYELTKDFELVEVLDTDTDGETS